MRIFRVQLTGTFHTAELINDKGDYCHSLQEAIAAANQFYPEEWECVYNGDEAMNYDDMLAECGIGEGGAS